MSVVGWASPVRQWRVLTEAFLLRFFENESMSSATELREGFVWVIAALATPGLFLPLYMYFRWAEVAAVLGVPAMQARVLLDKTIYLDLAFVGVSLLTAVIWQSLLVDRRDSLILGTLPVRVRAIIGGKMTALLMYAGIVTLGMHAAATFLYGFGLSSLVKWSMLFRFVAGQMLAAVAANMLIFAAVIGLQSVAVAIVGPRRFARISSLLQLVVIAGSTGMLLFLPVLMGAAADMPAWTADTRNGLMWLPPLWFVGLNEVISGSSFAVMPVLASRAVAALAVAVSLVIVAYPIAAWRTMSVAVEGGGPATRAAWTRSVVAWLTRRLGRDQHERGAAQFMLSALARSHQQRLILAVAGGAAVTMIAPAVLMYVAGTNINVWQHYWDGHARLSSLAVPPGADGIRTFVADVGSHYTNFHEPPVSLSLIAAPLLLNFVGALGLRLAMAIPSELASGWIFSAAPSPMFAGRNAARRLMVLVSVLLPLALSVPAWWMSWGWRHTLPLAIACALGMLTVVDGALWGFVGMPCAKPLATGRSNLTSRWPALIVLLYFYAYVFPSYQVGATLRPGPQYMLIIPTLIYLIVRRGSQSAAYANGMSGDPHGYISLDLSTTSAAPIVRNLHA